MSYKDTVLLKMAEEVKSLSKDPSTQVGAIIVEPVGWRVISAGYNGLPSKYPDDYSTLSREEKNLMSTHAEINAILNAAKNGVSTQGATIYVTEFPCSHCASALVNAGIKKVVVPVKGSLGESWKESCDISKEIFKTCGIELLKIGEE